MQLSRLLTTSVAGLVLLASSGEAHAYPLNPWGGLTSEGVIGLTPFLYVYPGSDPVPTSYYPYLYVNYGVSEKLDVFGGVGTGFVPGYGSAGSSFEIFPRYFIMENIAVTPHITLYPGSAIIVAPEVHGVWSSGKMALTVNAGWRPVIGLGGAGFTTGSVFAMIAPEYNFSERCSVFLEIDPIISLEGGGVATTIVPGVSFAADAGLKHYFAVAPQFTFVGGATGVSLGAWYSTTFGGGGEE